jgi:fatty acid desaturase
MIMNPQVLRESSRPNLARWLLAVLGDWAVILGAMGVARLAWECEHPLRWVLLLVAIVVIGARQHGLGIMGHDGAHRLASRRRSINDTLTCLLCLWPLGFALQGYRRFHFKHHQAVGTPDDPELIHKGSRWLGQWRLPFRGWKTAGHVVGDFLGGSLPHLGVAAYLTRPVSIRDQLGPAITLGTFLAVSWWWNCLWIPALWFGSMVTSFWAVFRIRIWTEHTVEDPSGDPTHRISAHAWQRFLFLPHNTWCHWEHHLYPQVPADQLPRIRRFTLEEGPPILSVVDLLQNLRREDVPERPRAKSDQASVRFDAGSQSPTPRSGRPREAAGSTRSAR